MSGLYKFLHIVLKPICRIIFKLKIVGVENIPKDGPFVLCSNHTSISDMVLLVAYSPRQIHFMAKKELFEVKLLAFFLKALGAFPVDRGGRDIASIRTACNIVKDGNVLGIFPEGTRYKDFSPPHEVKPGSAFIAIKTGADILPVSVYKEKGLRRSVTLRFGNIMKSDTLCDGKPTKENISAVSEKLHKAITDLWEMRL